MRKSAHQSRNINVVDRGERTRRTIIINITSNAEQNKIHYTADTSKVFISLEWVREKIITSSFTHMFHNERHYYSNDVSAANTTD